MQEILVYLFVVIALFFLVKKYVFPPKKKGGCGTDCGCH
nr:FeoB-associated Cys-rich membrane protein [uncultured Polaribacter sp.]